jgi:UDP-N-acetylglucosamine transferase subunit ALG13
VIFVTVGTQLPFERLVAAVDNWSGTKSPKPEVLAQVGAGSLDYGNLRSVRTLDGAQYSAAIADAELIIAHAGTGSILTALDLGIPVIVMPRDDRRGEHRDDHQMQTARQLEKMGLVSIAWSEKELPLLIDDKLRQPRAARTKRKRGNELVDYLHSYLRDVLSGDR